MRLKDWLKKNHMNIPLLAKKMGLSTPFLYKYINGAKRIGPDNAVKIEEITKGEISREEAMWPEQYNPDYVYNKDYYESERKR